jgi:hypothetical protein
MVLHRRRSSAAGFSGADDRSLAAHRAATAAYFAAG